MKLNSNRNEKKGKLTLCNRMKMTGNRSEIEHRFSRMVRMYTDKEKKE